MAESQKAGRGKRRNPDYGQLVGDVPKELIQQFKINCVKNNTTISNALTEAIQDWNKKVEQQND